MTALALRDQPAGDQLLVVEALLAQVLVERVAVARREPDAEALGSVLVEAALGEELPAGDPLRGTEPVDVELPRDLVRLDQPGPQVGVAARLRGAVALGVAQLDAVLVGEPLDGAR